MSTRPTSVAPTLLATAVLLALSGCRSSSDVAITAPRRPRNQPPCKSPVANSNPGGSNRWS